MPRRTNHEYVNNDFLLLTFSDFPRLEPKHRLRCEHIQLVILSRGRCLLAETVAPGACDACWYLLAAKIK